MVNRTVVKAIAVLFILHCAASPAVCRNAEVDDSSDEQDCLYEGQDACNRADLLGCVWCDLPRRCYSAARSLQLGAFCNSPLGKESAPIVNCEVGGETACSAREECRWCRSEVLDDGCFSAKEALRLPSEIFACPEETIRNPAERSLN